MNDQDEPNDHDGAHDHDAGARASTAMWSGALLIALGSAMVIVAVTGDSVFYVRSAMTVPLIVAGSLVVLLGFAAVTGVVAPTHAPRSIALVAVAALFVLVVRPGPLSVEAGLTYDASAGGRIRNRFEIPQSAVVGARADRGLIEERAVDLHAGQVYFASEQFPDVFDEVALRMIGQLDRSDDGRVHLVRFRISCCAADALRLSIGLDLDDEAEIEGADVEQGAWVEIIGRWDGDDDEPGIDVVGIREIEAPDQPYLTLRDD